MAKERQEPDNSDELATYREEQAHQDEMAKSAEESGYQIEVDEDVLDRPELNPDGSYTNPEQEDE